MRKIDELVDIYQCRNAMRVAEANKTTIMTRGRGADTQIKKSMTNRQFSEAIANLFPIATSDDIIPDAIETDPEGLQLHPQGVEKAIRKLAKGVANGCSGWTNQSIQAIFLNVADKARDETIEQLTKFFNMCTTGNIHPSVIDLFGMSRSILLDNIMQLSCQRKYEKSLCTHTTQTSLL